MYVNEQGHNWISGTSTVHLGLMFVTNTCLFQCFKMGGMQNVASVDFVIDLNIHEWLFVYIHHKLN